MGYYRHRHSCLGNCFGRCRVDRRNRHDSDQAQANRPVELQPVSPPAPTYSRQRSRSRRRPSQQQAPTRPRSPSRRRSSQQQTPARPRSPSRHRSSRRERHHEPPVHESAPRDTRRDPSRVRFASSHESPVHHVSDSRASLHTDPYRESRGSHHTEHQQSPIHHASDPRDTLFTGVNVSPLYHTRSGGSGHSVVLRASPRESQHSHSSLASYRYSRSRHAPGIGERLSTNPADYPHGEIQMIGAQWQRWVEDTHAPGCRVRFRRRPLQILTLLNERDVEFRWTAVRNFFSNPPTMLRSDLQSLSLPTGGNQYRKLLIEGPLVPHGEEPNEYMHSTSMGVIIAEDIARHDGPHWSEIAVGQYEMDYPIESLSHIYFTDIVNRNVVDFVVERLYSPILRVPWAEWNPVGDMARNWDYGTPEYQGMMGTTFGKAVAALLISVFPRGTFKIARVATWKDGSLQVRFDIESTENEESSFF
ncbi:unnamed protein product [Penicillium salamii]|uniref:Uncharacterized protein n=1 Tax=Penicillium salamii TaxID=1612424 RepID=A0A9W4JX82_9EURO|nr:unnamed protein product [Penicillium salamii]CAG7978720.1 unnamed protein product [Penicillium salamii]CAG8028830.1 unnamed protein product [Penicillium salamii]CAG8063760.1 unnamed protein product [Penicillium salamii]CAG8079254.1 unnamed protein product [Penicillium salamii]